MVMLRFKLLAAGVMVATGFGLSVGGGWSGSATAQVAPPGGPSGAPGSRPLPKTDPAIDKLRAEVEQAKMRLERAEREEAERTLLNLARSLEVRGPNNATRIEYEPVPKEGLTDFEERLAKREKSGWTFVGQVTMSRSGPTAMLAFRKTFPTPGVGGPGGGMSGAGGMGYSREYGEYASEGAAPGRPVLEVAVKFVKADFGTWDPKEIAEVISTLMADRIKANDYGGPVRFEPAKDSLTVIGTNEGIRVVIRLMEKLKK